jgi:hypothetical protein
MLGVITALGHVPADQMRIVVGRGEVFGRDVDGVARKLSLLS